MKYFLWIRNGICIAKAKTNAQFMIDRWLQDSEVTEVSLFIYERTEPVINL
jgi:hypothetical protein